MMQLRCWTPIIFGAGVLCLSTSRGAAQASGAGQDSLNEARKDLQELPATVNTPNDPTAKTINTGKLDLVIPSSGSGSNQPASSSENSEAVPSQGWLLDGVNKDKANSALARDAREAARGEGRQGKMNTAAATETAKAWTPLLQTWLLPQNRALIPTLFGSSSARGGPSENATATLPNFSNRSATSGNLAPRSPSSAVPAEWLTGDATYHDPLAQQTNPYLENGTAGGPSSSDFHMPRLTAPVSTLRSGEPSSQTEDNLYPTAGDGKLSAHRQEPIPPPTAPVVNQQKYFPQLDKF
jgi:hypothetical protein